jgi:hypothetical protein
MRNWAHKIIWAVGVFHLAFALFHLGFWRIFQWEKNLACLDTINRAVMQILNLQMAYVLILVGYLCFVHTKELVSTRLGKALLVGFALFWIFRMLEQVVFSGLSSPISIGLTIVFCIGGVICLAPVFLRSEEALSNQ